MKPLLVKPQHNFLLGLTLLLMCLLVDGKAANAATPTHAPPGTIETEARIDYSDDKSNTYWASAKISIMVNQVFWVDVTCDGDKSVNSNTTAVYTCTVTNTGNETNTFTITATSEEWTAKLMADDGTSGGVEIPQPLSKQLTADAAFTFYVGVAIPGGTANFTTKQLTVKVIGSGDPDVGDDKTITKTTKSLAPAITVKKWVRNTSMTGSNFDVSCPARPKDILEYRVDVKNEGAVKATNVILSETINSNLKYFKGSSYIGADGNTSTNNALKKDGASDELACAADAPACGTAYYDDISKITYHLGRSAIDSVNGGGGVLEVGDTVYVYYKVTVN